MTIEVIVLALFIVLLVAIELYYIARGKPTISERAQRLNASMSKGMLAGIFFLLGALTGWFIGHFNEPPPGG